MLKLILDLLFSQISKNFIQIEFRNEYSRINILAINGIGSKLDFFTNEMNFISNNQFNIYFLGRNESSY